MSADLRGCPRICAEIPGTAPIPADLRESPTFCAFLFLPPRRDWFLRGSVPSDLAANHFWEAMGFVPLAYRAGSEKRARVHIFWQKRIRADDATPWWFPAQTQGGSMANRLVFPIPPGTHWSDARPMVLPAAQKLLPQAADTTRSARNRRDSKKETSAARPKPAPLSGNLFFSPSAITAPPREAPAEQAISPSAKKRKPRNDPKMVAAARELRDRWLEHVNAGGGLLLTQGKYQVHRPALAAPPDSPRPIALLADAA